MLPYVIQVDTTHKNVPHLPADLIAVMGYDTGSPDIDWTDQDWARFPLAGRVVVDQSLDLAQFAAGKANVADVERGAATVESFIKAAHLRQLKNLESTLYISIDALPAAVTQITAARISGVRHFVADYNMSAVQAIAYLNANPVAVGVQFASPGSNPSTRLPGSALTLVQAGADLSVKRSTWFGSPSLAATAWAE